MLTRVFGRTVVGGNSFSIMFQLQGKFLVSV